MSKRSDALLVQDIKVSVGRILVATKGMQAGDFEDDVVVQDAVIRNFEVIGEAAKNVSMEMRSTHPAIDWNGMVGFRNFLIHVYFGVDLSVVWRIIQDDLPTRSATEGDTGVRSDDPPLSARFSTTCDARNTSPASPLG